MKCYCYQNHSRNYKKILNNLNIESLGLGLIMTRNKTEAMFDYNVSKNDHQNRE